jgi:hypothetical protein
MKNTEFFTYQYLKSGDNVICCHGIGTVIEDENKMITINDIKTNLIKIKLISGKIITENRLNIYLLDDNEYNELKIMNNNIHINLP